jgi:hypothetical protein
MWNKPDCVAAKCPQFFLNEIWVDAVVFQILKKPGVAKERKLFLVLFNATQHTTNHWHSDSQWHYTQDTREFKIRPTYSRLVILCQTLSCTNGSVVHYAELIDEDRHKIGLYMINVQLFCWCYSCVVTWDSQRRKMICETLTPNKNWLKTNLQNWKNSQKFIK